MQRKSDLISKIEFNLFSIDENCNELQRHFDFYNENSKILKNIKIKLLDCLEEIREIRNNIKEKGELKS
jgi:hypothetical protein